MFDEITEEMYKARDEVILDIAQYAANSLEYIGESLCQVGIGQVGDVRDIHHEGGRGEITREMIEDEIIEGARDSEALYYTDTHTLVLAWQSYRYADHDAVYGAGYRGASLDALLARVLIDMVFENANGELERVVRTALQR